MLDKDLANLFGVETKVLNQAVKRNIDRFPQEFRFQLTKEEVETLVSQNTIKSNVGLRSQNVTLKKGRGQHRKYLPYSFTEQGFAMLSAVLKSEPAIKASIHIMKAFVAMRKFLATKAQIIQRLDQIELNQLEHRKNFIEVFEAIEQKEIVPNQSIIYKDKFFEAHVFVTKIIKSAKNSILLIDNYIDENVLVLMSYRRKNVNVKILTKSISKRTHLAIKKYQKQYGQLDVEVRTDIHDRFLIIDKGKDIYHFGASLKDLGNKLSAFSKIEKDGLVLLDEVNKI